MKTRLLLIIALFFFINGYAQGWGQIQKIVPDDRFDEQQFGATVTIDGNYAVVGILASNFAKDAYVYENDGNGNWIQLQKLESPDQNQFDHFGTQVAIDGDFILVGAWGDNEDANNSNFVQGAGAAYVFKKQASGLFGFEQKIVASNREQNNHFGYTLDLSGDYAIIGALRDAYDVDGNNYTENAGAAFIFERDGSGTWNEVQKIVASDRATEDYFAGNCISIDGDYAVIGAWYEDEDETGMNTLEFAGSAYIFERDGSGVWNEAQKIVASNRQGSELFGSDVAINGNFIIVGAQQGNVAAGYTGSVYIFERNGTGTWNEIQEIVSADAEGLDRFGKSVAFDGNHIIVGAYQMDIGSTLDAGAAFMFEKDGAGLWNQVAEMYDANANTSDYFGFDVAISGDYAIVGAYSEDEDETGMNTLSSAGSAFIFDVDEPNTLSVLETDISGVLKVYPNPAENVLYIDTNNQEMTDFRIVDLTGKVIYNAIPNNNHLNTGWLQSGTYLVHVKTGKGSVSKKIIKK